MANYFNITLDTTAPSCVTLAINDGAEYTTSTAVTLSIGCSGSETTGYQMKIWGISGAETESDATWETFADSKAVTLNHDYTISYTITDKTNNHASLNDIKLVKAVV